MRAQTGWRCASQSRSSSPLARKSCGGPEPGAWAGKDFRLQTPGPRYCLSWSPEPEARARCLAVASDASCGRRDITEEEPEGGSPSGSMRRNFDCYCLVIVSP